MTDRESFEDTATIARYREAIPEPDTRYRVELRSRLADAPAERSRRLPRLRWRWTAGASLVAAGAVAASLLLIPFGPRGDAPLSPRAVLARAVTAAMHITPYRTSAEISFSTRPDDGPDALTRDLGTHHITITSSVRDTTHWRVDGHILQPSLQSDNFVAVANGRSAIYYHSMTNRAARIILKPSFVGAALLSETQGSFGLALQQTLQGYLQELNRNAGLHARFIGRSTALGRTADVIEVWPVGRSSSGPCNSAKSCAAASVGYGRARMWIDDQHGVLLRYEVRGMPAGGDYPHNLTYRVTAVTFGAGPTAAELSYHPPVRPVIASLNTTSSHRGGFTLGGTSSARWHVPHGFIEARTPVDAHGHQYTLSGQGQSQDQLGGIISVDALFTKHPAPNPTGRSAGPTPPPGGPFLYIQEQLRATAMPASLAAGSPRSAGTCIVHTGTYADGIHWLALERGHVTLLAAADQINEGQLIVWAATRVCG